MGFMDWLRGGKPEEAKQIQADDDLGEPIQADDVFTTNTRRKLSDAELAELAFPVIPAQMKVVGPDGSVMDAMSESNAALSLKNAYTINQQRMPESIAGWYVNQGFIGYQMCAVLAQNWLIMKACSMGAKDAARNGWKLSVNDGTKLSPEILSYLKKRDRQLRIQKNITELSTFNRVFGVRIAFAVIESNDPDFYLKPFNLDSIRPNSYKGITQVDPYWVTPELDDEAVSNPAGINFYEPTYWRIGGKRYHRSHLILTRYEEVSDILKPSYLYGGIPLTQLIYERVYAAERTANEAPQLAMTKRMNVRYMNLDRAMANPTKFQRNMEDIAAYRDNYGVLPLNTDERFEQTDTALSDLDVTIMTQYQLVAAIAKTPATKLMGTSPKGFNATGEFEMQAYREELAGIQSHEMEPLLERHYECVIRSEVAPKFGINPFEFEIEWNPLDEPSEEQVANINKIKSDTYAQLSSTGSIDGTDIRAKVMTDPTFGFEGLTVEEEESEDETDTLSDPLTGEDDEDSQAN